VVALLEGVVVSVALGEDEALLCNQSSSLSEEGALGGTGGATSGSSSLLTIDCSSAEPQHPLDPDSCNHARGTQWFFCDHRYVCVVSLFFCLRFTEMVFLCYICPMEGCILNMNIFSMNQI